MKPILSRDGSPHVTDEVINTISHVVAGCFALLGSALLIAQAASAHKIWEIVGFSVYGLALVNLFTFSSLHHGMQGSPQLHRILRTFDYIAVFGLIGGTVTPLVLVLHRDLFGWVVLSVVWAIAALGITLRAIYHDLPKHITNTLFIVLGWIPAVLVAGRSQHIPAFGLGLLIVGGLLYSFGFVLFIVEKPNPKPGIFGFHEIWHIIVTLAATCHYFFMYFYVLPR